MAISMEPFQKKYWPQVCTLVGEMFHYPENYDYTDNYKQMFSYDWNYDIDIKQFPYKYGMLIFDDDKVVGFLGAYYSKRRLYFEDSCEYEEVVYMNCTRYAIEKKYRIMLYSAIKKLMDGVDIVTDFSASESMYEVFIKALKFKEYSSCEMRFYPVPWNIKDGTTVREIYDDLEGELKILYKDHKKYGVRVFRVQENEEVGYVFWEKKISKKSRSEYVRVLRVDNKDLFSRNIWKIMWEMQKSCFANSESVCEVGKELFEKINNHQLYMAECDGFFLNESLLNHPLYMKWPTHKLFLKTRDDIKCEPDLDLLYSELVIK